MTAKRTYRKLDAVGTRTFNCFRASALGPDILLSQGMGGRILQPPKPVRQAFFTLETNPPQALISFEIKARETTVLTA
jgi:hypothetical protein